MGDTGTIDKTEDSCEERVGEPSDEEVIRSKTLLDKKGNPLNDLSATEYLEFLKVVEVMPRTTKDDLDEALELGSVPLPAISDTIQFFTKSGGKILDLFSGRGRTLMAAANASRTAVGVDIWFEGQKAYKSLIDEDMFADEFPYNICDALQFVKASKADEYDLVLVDPPRCRPNKTDANRNPLYIGNFQFEQYAKYLACVIWHSIPAIKNKSHVAVFLDDVIKSGTLYHIPGMVANLLNDIPGIRLRIMKIWHFHRRSTLGNLGIACAVPNMSYMLAYQRWDKDLGDEQCREAKNFDPTEEPTAGPDKSEKGVSNGGEEGVREQAGGGVPGVRL